MRPIRWSARAVLTAGLAAAGLALAGCGDDSNGPGPDENVAPTANFTSECTDLACDFSDLSSDADGTVASVAWEFGDGGTAGIRNPSHTYAGNGPGLEATYTVTMTVTDNDGAEGTLSRDVTVSEPGTQPSNNAPTAEFDIDCASLTCTFTDESTDPDGNGTIVSWAWEFGDGETAAVQNPPAHTYTATGLQSYTVRLTVTDNGGLSSSRSVQISVAPPATLTCNGVACTLLLPEASTVTVTLESRECTARNNTFRITAPALETLFTDGCYAPDVGTSFDLNGGAAYGAGTELEAEVLSGSVKLETEPGLKVTGSFAQGWLLEFDDGEDATFPEPDFNDLVIHIVATPAP
jgi:PKD repeat protein